MIGGRLFSSKGLFSSFALKTTQVAHPCFLPPSLIPFYFIPPVPPVQLLSFFGSPFPKRADERANIRPELRREDLSASAYPCLPVICLEWAWPGGTRSPPAMPSRLLYCLRRDVVRIGEWMRGAQPRAHTRLCLRMSAPSTQNTKIRIAASSAAAAELMIFVISSSSSSALHPAAGVKCNRNIKAPTASFDWFADGRARPGECYRNWNAMVFWSLRKSRRRRSDHCLFLVTTNITRHWYLLI